MYSNQERKLLGTLCRMHGHAKSRVVMHKGTTFDMQEANALDWAIKVIEAAESLDKETMRPRLFERIDVVEKRIGKVEQRIAAIEAAGSSGASA